MPSATLQGQDAPLPQTLEEAAASLRALARAGRRAWPESAQLLAHARRRWFHADPRGWAEWARETCGAHGSDLHHRRAAGDMLLAVRGRKCFAALMDTDKDMLTALTRIPPEQLPAFLSANPPEGMGRDALRAAVAAWLGEEPGGSGGPTPASLAKAMARAMALAGGDPMRLADAIRTAEDARRAADAARAIWTAAAVRMAELGDREGLLAARCDMADLAAQMAAVAEAAAQTAKA